MEKVNILWADDEIELLKPHILFLKEKGYNVNTVNNGGDAIDLFKTEDLQIYQEIKWLTNGVLFFQSGTPAIVQLV